MIYISPSPNTNSPSDWTVGNRGRDSFGDFVRSPISPVEIVCMLAEVGAWGVNLHDNDLVPIDATCAESDAIIRNFKKACKESGLVVRSEEHTSELQSRLHLVCRLLLEKKNTTLTLHYTPRYLS